MNGSGREEVLSYTTYITLRDTLKDIRDTLLPKWLHLTGLGRNVWEVSAGHVARPFWRGQEMLKRVTSYKLAFVQSLSAAIRYLGLAA